MRQITTKLVSAQTAIVTIDGKCGKCKARKDK